MIQAKRRFNFSQGLDITVDAVRSIPKLHDAKTRLGSEFIERLMLAVTEVNGCAACAWAHTKAALEAGISQEEISQLLSGDASHTPLDQAVAVAFAQHYADSTGSPSKEAWQRLQTEYGSQGASDILAMIRMIMWGNAYGIPMSALSARLHGQPEQNSSLLYEIAMPLSAVPTLPIAKFLAWRRSDPLAEPEDISQGDSQSWKPPIKKLLLGP